MLKVLGLWMRDPARRWHTFGGRRIENSQGGGTAASPFVCRNVGGPPCLVGLHVQNSIAEGTWGHESPHFGYNLPRLGAHGRKLAEQEFFRRMLAWRLENRGLEVTKSPPEAPKSRPRPSKIEPGALQDAIFKDM